MKFVPVGLWGCFDFTAGLWLRSDSPCPAERGFEKFRGHIFIYLLLTLCREIFRHFQPRKQHRLPASNITRVTWERVGTRKTLGPAQLSSSSGSDLFLRDCFLNTFWFAECFPKSIFHIPSTAPLLRERKKPSSFNTEESRTLFFCIWVGWWGFTQKSCFKQIKPLLKQ